MAAISLPRDRTGAPVDATRPGTGQTLSFTGTSSASTTFTSTLLRVVSTEDCWIAVGSSPTAVASTGMLLIAGRPERIVVRTGEKVAAIRAGADGSLNIVELA